MWTVVFSDLRYKSSTYSMYSHMYILKNIIAINHALLFVILIDIECPAGMVYQQCGQACPQTCDTVESTDCVGGCVEGCFCPSGKVLWNGNCVNASECAGIQVVESFNKAINIMITSSTN